MADFAENFTPRYRAQYRAAGVVHTVGVRLVRGTAEGSIPAVGSSIIANVFAAFDSKLPDDFAFISAYYIRQDENIQVGTATLPGFSPGAIPVADYSPVAKAISTIFSGRTAQGHTGKFIVFGVQWNILDPADASANGVVGIGESTEVATARGALVSAGPPGIDNLGLNWYTQVTINIDDAVLKKVRRGLVG
jgi:hypothetical protein